MAMVPSTSQVMTHKKAVKMLHPAIKPHSTRKATMSVLLFLLLVAAAARSTGSTFNDSTVRARRDQVQLLP